MILPSTEADLIPALDEAIRQQRAKIETCFLRLTLYS